MFFSVDNFLFVRKDQVNGRKKLQRLIKAVSSQNSSTLSTASFLSTMNKTETLKGKTLMKTAEIVFFFNIKSR